MGGGVIIVFMVNDASDKKGNVREIIEQGRKGLANRKGFRF